MLPWVRITHTNEEGLSWTEARYIHAAPRCSKVGRSYYKITNGTTWRTNDWGKSAKLEFKRGPTLDVRIKRPTREAVERVLEFTFQCLRDDPTPLDPAQPIRTFYPKELKHMICCIRYYESIHPKFGRAFQGNPPMLSIRALANMVVDAFQSKTIRIPAKALRFDRGD